jgi:septum formation topological specificity factor MinE
LEAPCCECFQNLDVQVQVLEWFQEYADPVFESFQDRVGLALAWVRDREPDLALLRLPDLERELVLVIQQFPNLDQERESVLVIQQFPNLDQERESVLAFRQFPNSDQERESVLAILRFRVLVQERESVLAILRFRVLVQERESVLAILRFRALVQGLESVLAPVRRDRVGSELLSCLELYVLEPESRGADPSALCDPQAELVERVVPQV